MDNEKLRIVSRDGNPDRQGMYDVVIIYEVDEYDDELPLPKGSQRYAIWTSRWFGPARENDWWIMQGQPKSGLVWHEESGSFAGEYVYAWLPPREYPEVDLPEGVRWGEEI